MFFFLKILALTFETHLLFNYLFKDCEVMSTYSDSCFSKDGYCIHDFWAIGQLVGWPNL